MFTPFLKLQIFLICLVFPFTVLIAQTFEYSGSINSKAVVFTGPESPFWLHSNQRGRIDENTVIAGWASGLARYEVNDDTAFNLGLGILYKNGYLNKILLDESYLEFRTHWFSAVVGRKQTEEVFRGISASNENITWSLNARPMPGIQLGTIEPVFLNGINGIGFKAVLEDYIMNDERYVENTRIHHKSFHLVYKNSPKFQINAGLLHFVQYAGISPDYGKLPSSLGDYKNIFLGIEGDNNVGGEEANALGNHLGSYEINLQTEIRKYKIALVYNHIFEDGSGRILYNTPDGRYGIYVEDVYKLSVNPWVKAVMYELYYTRDQSEGSGTSDGNDNYFVNNLYRTGWLYDNRVIGVPFITVNEERTRVSNNTILVHHLGMTGMAFEKYPYKFLTSYRKNYGNKGSRTLINNILSSFLDVQVYEGTFDLNVQLGVDIPSDDSVNFGAGFQLSRNFF